MCKLVLVVEDDATIRRLLTMSLERQGFVVQQLGTAPEVLTRVLVTKPDLMLLDMNLPGGTGFDVLKQVREHYSAQELPIVVISALSQKNNIERCFQLGAQAYLVKPIALAELNQQLVRFLG
jgi:CheY-like chemotaxis protein